MISSNFNPISCLLCLPWEVVHKITIFEAFSLTRQQLVTHRSLKVFNSLEYCQICTNADTMQGPRSQLLTWEDAISTCLSKLFRYLSAFDSYFKGTLGSCVTFLPSGKQQSCWLAVKAGALQSNMLTSKHRSWSNLNSSVKSLQPI